MKRTRDRKQNSVPIRIMKKLVLLLLIIGIPAVIFISTFHIEKIEVVGAQRYTSDEIISHLVQTRLDSNSISLYLKYHYLTNVNLPFIEKVDVAMKDTHSVTIFVYEKMIAGCVELMGEYLYFDKDGIIVESSPKLFEGVPIVKGLKFSKLLLGQKLVLEEQKQELFDVIIDLTQLITKYDLKVDNLSFNSKYEVTLTIGDITVLLGRKDAYDEALSELKNILAEAEGMEINIDMRNFVRGTEVIIAKPKKRQNR